ncbi:MAG: ATP-dependent DNA helicase RecQ [Flavobacteriales bacterium]
MYPEPVDVLREYWGYPAFRPQQEDIVRSVLLNRDTLALMPTGGGKSICFQVPALAREGICLVISPLIALMKDQVDRLRSMNIKATYLSSAQSKHELDIALDNAIYGGLKFLYVSPERLKNELFIERFKRMKVNLIAVDEAHCISQWGHDFRPAYREIAAVRELHPNVPVMAVTASATPEVANDIVQQLKMRDAAVFELPMVRNNLHYAAIEEAEPLGRLLRICKRLEGSGIIYAGTRKAVRNTAEFLTGHGIAAGYYHAGLDVATKERLQNEWLQGKFPVMVATNAFGMGIDKPDVRYVVHTQAPQNLENYVQEAGRGGRDGNDSWAILLWNTAMAEEQMRMLKDSFPPRELIREVYHNLCAHFSVAYGAGQEETYEFVMGDFVRKYNYKAPQVMNALEILMISGYLQLSEGMLIPSRVMVRMTNSALYDFQVRNPSFDAFLRLLLRSYGGLFETYTRIDEHYLARKTGWGTNRVVEMLQKLDEMEVLAYRPRTTYPTITLTVGRQRSENLVITPESYELRMERSIGRYETMMNYMHLDGCRSKFIAHYFGDLEADNCGHCDWCRKHHIPKVAPADIVRGSLREKPMTLNEVLDLNAEVPREVLILEVNRMLEEGELVRDDDDLLHLA